MSAVFMMYDSVDRIDTIDVLPYYAVVFSLIRKDKV